MHRHSDDVSRNQAEIRGTIEALRNLRTDMLDLEERFSPHMQNLAPGQRHSARNLVHYLALRAHDLRKLQKNLAEIGVSSLGRSEGQIMDDLDCVLDILGRLQRSSSAVDAPRKKAVDGGRMKRRRKPARAKGERVGIATPFSQSAPNTGRPAA